MSTTAACIDASEQDHPGLANAKVRVGGFELRPYQREACNAAWTQLQTHQSTLIVAPTGTGKTAMFAAFAKAWRAHHGRVLVLAHRAELIDQACDKISKFTGLSTAVEMGERRADPLFMPDVVVASVQTMARAARREKFAPDAFSLIIVDEAHHATADTYQAVLDYFASSKVLGVTATPDRLDGKGMREAFESVASVYEIRDAIQDGWLVPIRQKTVRIDHLDLSDVSKTRFGDLNEHELEAALLEDVVLHEMAVPVLELAEARPTIVFAASVAHARALAQVLCMYRNDCALAVDGSSSTDDRASAVAAFTSGKAQFLVNCALFTEGFDAPLAACVAVARPTGSRALYAQMVGRGTRILGATYAESVANGKSDLLVLDLKGNAGRHSLVNCTDILDGNKDAEVRERTAKILSANPDTDVLSALDEASNELAEEKRLAHIICRAQYQANDVDPFVVLGASSRAGRWGGLEPTEKQLSMLERAGIDAKDIDRGQASELINKIMLRRSKGLCTFKQAKRLARHGLNPDVSFDDAKRALGAIAKTGWRRVPSTIRTDPAFRVERRA